MNEQLDLRPIDQKRLDGLQTIIENDPLGKDTWFVHSVLAQCFLPYREQKGITHWHRKNGFASLSITADTVEDENGEPAILGLPYGAKPRLLMSKIQTCAIKNQSPVIPIETSMTGMLKELGFKVTGGKQGTVGKFKAQTARLAASRFRVITSERGHNKISRSRVQNADIFKEFDLWFSKDENQKTLWPTEIVLTDDFYHNLKEHAIPYDYRGLSHIQNNARAIDIFLWMTQRLQRIPKNKPLFLNWHHLYEMFGGGIAAQRNFPVHFKKAMLAARTAYPEANVNEYKDGFEFKSSRPPIKKTKIGYTGK